MARKICTDCEFRTQDRTVIGPELCTVCLDYAGMENVHQDYGNDHDAEYSTKTCPVCHPELDRRYKQGGGHTNTVAKTRGDHSGCDHMRTPAARARCRKARATAVQNVAGQEWYNTDQTK